MFLGNCPTKGGLLIGNESIRALINIEPGVIVMRWQCPCGDEHFTAYGRAGQVNPQRADVAK